MRRFGWIPLFALGLFLARSARAATTTYYVSNSGDNAHDGKSPASAWKTITRVDAASLHPGDSVLFKRGDTFHGTITPTASGTTQEPITYGAYGTGESPIISGFTTVSTWTHAGGNVWTATVAKTGARPNTVVINGVLQPLGRYPKPTAKNGGYLTIASYTGSTSLTDPALASAPNLVGGELILRMVHWAYDFSTITAQTATTLTFPSATGYPLAKNFGYFIQNCPATLTANGDWYYSTTKQQLGLYSTTQPSSAQVSTIDRLVSINKESNLDFTDLSFEGSSAESFYDQGPSSFVNVQNCSFKFAGTYAIYMRNVANVVIDGNTITGSLNDGIDVNGSQSSAVTVTHNVISDTGTVPWTATGITQADDDAIHVDVASVATIERNTITNTGYCPITFYGNDVSIKNNVIDNFCSALDDGGGIYTWNGPAATYSNRTVAGNIIENGIGAPQGTPQTAGLADGIYLDLNTNHVEVTGNTAYQISGLGLHLTSPAWETIKDNTFFDNTLAWYISRRVTAPTKTYQIQEISNLDVTDNLFVSRTAAETSFMYNDEGLDQPAPSTLQARFAAMGTIDHNYYYSPDAVPFRYKACPTDTTPSAQCMRPPFMSLSQWSTASGFEASSVAIPPYPAYTLNSLVGANLFPDGTFETGITAVHANPTNDASWDQTSKLSGKGSLEVTMGGAPSLNAVVYLSGAIGAVSSSKKYILRVSTLGTTGGGLLGASFRDATGLLAPLQYQPYGTTRVDHEFLIDAPTDSTAASFVLTLLQTGGTTYIDDVAVHEADATATNPDDYVKLEVNKTDASKTVPLDKTYVDYKATPHCGSLTLAPFSSVVLFASTVACTPPATDAGSGDGAPVDGAPVDGASGDGASASSPDGGTPDAGGSATTNNNSSGGCNCNAAGSHEEPPWPLLLGCVGFALGTVRRRKRQD